MIINKKRKSNDEKNCIIYDNASINKEKVIREFILKKKTHVLTWTQYWPSLNSTEKLILSILKILKYNDEGK